MWTKLFFAYFLFHIFILLFLCLLICRIDSTWGLRNSNSCYSHTANVIRVSFSMNCRASTASVSASKVGINNSLHSITVFRPFVSPLAPFEWENKREKIEIEMRCFGWKQETLYVRASVNNLTNLSSISCVQMYIFLSVPVTFFSLFFFHFCISHFYRREDSAYDLVQMYLWILFTLVVMCIANKASPFSMMLLCLLVELLIFSFMFFFSLFLYFYLTLCCSFVYLLNESAKKKKIKW